MRGILLRGVGGFYYARDEAGTVHTVRAQGKLRRGNLKPRVGDIVEITPGNDDEHGWIMSVEPRRNTLFRPPVANIDVICVVAAAAAPDPDLLLADRLLLNARRAGIGVRLIVTKCDLAPETAAGILRQYRGAEVEPAAVSSRTGEGLGELKASLAGRTVALAGQSGAGKSTLINALYGLELETGDLSRRIERGKNTTRHCELIEVEGGGMILDTPGFSLLESDLFDPVEMKDYWPEFRDREGQCFFQPCWHDSEPRCAVREAVSEGMIDPERHGRYRVLLSEMRERWRDRYD